MHVTLNLAMAFLTAGLYAFLAWRLGRRHVAADVRPALNMFRAWWAALAFVALAEPVQVILLGQGLLPLWLFETIRQAVVVAVCAGLWALLCYLVFAYRGSRRSWAPLGIAYAAVAAWVFALLNRAGDPAALVLRDGAVEPEPALDLGPSGLALIAVLLLPQIGAAAA